MGKTISVFLVDMSNDFCSLLRDDLELQQDLVVIGTANNGEVAYQMLREQTPDVLVTDLLLCGIDGLSLLQKLREEGRLPPTLIVSGFVTPWTVQMASGLGAAFYLAKPCSSSAVITHIREAARPLISRIPRYDPEIGTYLNEFGILSYVSGRRYLMEAIQRTMNNPEVLHGITKILYPDLAKQFGSTSMCVEHSIRRAVTGAWNRMSPEQRNQCLGGIFTGMQRAPSNARFISAVANYIRQEGEYDCFVLQA